MVDTPKTISSLLSVGDNLWVGSEEGLLRLMGDQLEEAHPDAPFTGSLIEDLSSDSAGRLLIAGAAGGFLFDPGEGRWQQLVAADEGRLMAVAPGRTGLSWFGTHHRGLLRVDGSRVERLDQASGLPVLGIRSLLAGPDGGLWIGSYGGGICRLDHEAFVLFTEDHGLPSHQVLGIDEGPDGGLWIGMLEGGVARFDGRRFETYGLESGLRSLAVSHLAVDGGGDLWVGTLRGGLHRFERAEKGGSFESVELGLPTPPLIFHLLFDRDGMLWLSTWGNGLLRLDPRSGDVRALTAQDGLVGDQIFSTSQAPDGRIWIAARDGFQILDPASLSFSEMGDGSAIGRVRASVHDPAGRSFLATDRGLAYWRDEQLTFFGRSQGLVSNTIYLAAFDGRDRRWLGSERGRDRLFIDADGEPTDVRQLGASEGFIGIETNQNAVHEDAQGRLWFGTRGLARFDPAEEPSPGPPPRVHLTAVGLYDGTALDMAADGSLELPFDQHDVLFQFVGLDFTAPEAVRYRYHLLGHSESWSPPSARRQAFFPRLDPGRYTFEVAASSGGEWSEPIRFSFAIRPPFWATWWFYSLAALAFGLALAFSVGNRVARSRRRRLELERA
ncbi:MAG: triple tyrosine motif-containing protein, partial [Acidobacteriota bacterium]